MAFNNTIPEWKNTGVEPSDEKKTTGFKGAEKPPAGWFNWFWNKVTVCIKEIQDKITALHKVSTSGDYLDLDNQPVIEFDATNGVDELKEAGIYKCKEGTSQYYIYVTEANGFLSQVKVSDGNVYIRVRYGEAWNDWDNYNDMITALRNDIGGVENKLSPYIYPITITSTDGVAYTSPYIDGLVLENGMEITVIPNMTSTSKSITLDIGTGVHSVRVPYGFNTGATGLPELDNFYTEGKPVKLVYSETDNTLINGTRVYGVWKVSDKQITSAAYLSGTVPTEHGGTDMETNSIPDLALKLAQSTTIPATSTDGTTYTATIEGLTEIYNGMEITIIPNMTSKTNGLKLNINELGDVSVRQPLSFTTFVATAPSRDGFLCAGVPCRLMYHDSYANGGIWLMADKQKTSAQDLYGNVPIESGGTGASTAEAAIKNLGGARVVTGSYVGTGYRIIEDKYTVNDVTFPMPERPKVLFIQRQSSGAVGHATALFFESDYVDIAGHYLSVAPYSTEEACDFKVMYVSQTIRLSNNINSDEEYIKRFTRCGMNEEGVTYIYTAII